MMEAKTWSKTIALVAFSLWMLNDASGQEKRLKERYIESNWGIALIGDFVNGTNANTSPTTLLPFPGTSILVGQRKYFSEHGFIDAQIGLAFPSLVTAKMGVGHTGQKGGHFSAGLRLFPTHAFIQTGIPSGRSNRNLNAKKQRRLERRGKSADDIKRSEWAFSMELSPILVGDLLLLGEEVRTISLYSNAMITAGHRWIF